MLNKKEMEALLDLTKEIRGVQLKGFTERDTALLMLGIKSAIELCRIKLTSQISEEFAMEIDKIFKSYYDNF